MIRLVANFYVKKEHLDEALALAKELVAETRKEEGCAQYDLAQALESPELIVILESWESQETLAAHSASEHFTRIVPALKGLCENVDTKRYLQVL